MNIWLNYLPFLTLAFCVVKQTCEQNIWRTAWARIMKSGIQFGYMMLMTWWNCHKILSKFNWITPLFRLRHLTMDWTKNWHLQVVFRGKHMLGGTVFHKHHSSSHYKSMETLGFQSNQIAYATAIKPTFLKKLLLWTFLQSFSFIPHTASEELIFFNIFKIEPFGCHDNQSNWEVWTKSICLEKTITQQTF